MLHYTKAVELYDPDYRSLGLLSNRALAYEGLSDWEGAVRDYSEAIRLSRDIGAAPPYVLNSRGNALASLVGYQRINILSYSYSDTTIHRL